jgi:hypothetical protein
MVQISNGYLGLLRCFRAFHVRVDGIQDGKVGTANCGAGDHQFWVPGVAVHAVECIRGIGSEQVWKK